MQSVACGSLTYVRFCSCSFRLSSYCSTGHGFNTGSRSTSRLQTGRHEALFEIRDGYLRRTSIKFNSNMHVVRTCSCSFRLSRSTALQVMASTLNRSQLLDYTRAGVRRNLKFVKDVDWHRTYVKFNLVCAYVKRNGPCMVCPFSVRAWAVQYPFKVRSIVA